MQIEIREVKTHAAGCKWRLICYSRQASGRADDHIHAGEQKFAVLSLGCFVRLRIARRLDQWRWFGDDEA